MSPESIFQSGMEWLLERPLSHAELGVLLKDFQENSFSRIDTELDRKGIKLMAENRSDLRALFRGDELLVTGYDAFDCMAQMSQREKLKIELP